VVGRNIAACSALFTHLTTMMKEGAPAVNLITEVLAKTGIDEEIALLSTQDLKATQEAEDRLSAIEPFQDAARAHAGTGGRAIMALLDDISTQARKLTETGDAVTVSTIHGAKGLEWPLVVGAALVDGVLPGQSSNLSEERRLFYVCCTRARDVLVLSYHWTSAGERPQVCKPSSFIKEAQAGGHIVDSSWSELIPHITRAPR
jgi:superfamily I DNA/RNA helicase